VKVPTRSLPRGVDNADGALHMLIGQYTVTAAADDPLFTAEPLSVVVLGGSYGVRPPALTLVWNLKDSAVQEVDRQVQARISQCAKRVELQPSGCPFQVNRIVIGEANVHWAIVDRPQITVQIVDNSNPLLAPAVVRTRVKGHASVTYDSIVSAGGARATSTDVVDIDVRGDVKVDDNKVVWTG
jgi:hypothetical protein